MSAHGPLPITRPSNRPSQRKGLFPLTAVAKQTGRSNQKPAVADASWMADRSRIEIISAEQKLCTNIFIARSNAWVRNFFYGYVVDPLKLHKRFVVEILLDGVPIKLLRAEQYDPKLRNRGFGDGCYAFEFVAKPGWLDRHHVIEARIANMGDRLAHRDSAFSSGRMTARKRQSA